MDIDSELKFDKDIAAFQEMRGLARSKGLIDLYSEHKEDIANAVAKTFPDKPLGRALDKAFMGIIGGGVLGVRILYGPATFLESLGTKLIDKPLHYADRLKNNIVNSLRR